MALQEAASEGIDHCESKVDLEKIRYSWIADSRQRRRFIDYRKKSCRVEVK